LRFDPFGHLYATYASQTPRLLLTSCLLIPYPYVPERYGNLFPLNPPTWSLFWEYVASVAYALGLARLRLPLLWVATLLAAGALCYEARTAGWLGGGWDGSTMAAGAIRVSYSFLAGLLVYRAGWRIRSRLGFGSLSVLLAAAFLVPFAPATNWLVEPLLVLGYFPLLVALGAGAAPPTPAVARLCCFLGELSYPLYMVHYPFLWVFGSYVAAYHPAPGTAALLIVFSTLALGLFAYGVLVFVDVPLRRYLSGLGQAGRA
jgi:peptidoglycan/LPS O-acetylase OafA/YrhL